MELQDTGKWSYRIQGTLVTVMLEVMGPTDPDCTGRKSNAETIVKYSLEGGMRGRKLLRGLVTASRTAERARRSSAGLDSYRVTARTVFCELHGVRSCTGGGKP